MFIIRNDYTFHKIIFVLTKGKSTVLSFYTSFNNPTDILLPKGGDGWRKTFKNLSFKSYTFCLQKFKFDLL